MGDETLLSVVVGGAIGFFAALGMELIKEFWKKKDEQRRVGRLLEMLREELTLTREMLDTEMILVDSDGLDFIFGFGDKSKEMDGVLYDAISRLEKNSVIYVSQAPYLLELPGNIPNLLTRFYSRLQSGCIKMRSAIAEGDLELLREIKASLLNEAKVLVCALDGK